MGSSGSFQYFDHPLSIFRIIIDSSRKVSDASRARRLSAPGGIIPPWWKGASSPREAPPLDSIGEVSALLFPTSPDPRRASDEAAFSLESIGARHPWAAADSRRRRSLVELTGMISALRRLCPCLFLLVVISQIVYYTRSHLMIIK